MPVPESVVGAYETYLAAMSEANKSRRRIDGLLGLGAGAGSERCQDDFVSQLKAAVDGFASSGPDTAAVSETLEYMFSQAREHREDQTAYWMLLASHVFALPLIDLLGPEAARGLRLRYEDAYPRRERFPAQKTVIAALKDREKSK